MDKKNIARARCFSRRQSHLQKGLERLEARTLLANVISQTWSAESSPNKLILQFNADMRAALQAADADVTNTTTDTPLSGGTIAFTNDGRTATFTWANAHGSSLNHPAGVLPDGNYQFVLSHLAAGTSSDDVYTFFVKTGDVNGDRVVNAADYDVVHGNQSTSFSGLSNGDVNYDGRVDEADLDTLGTTYGSTLPQTPTSSNSISAAALSSTSIAVNWGSFVNGSSSSNPQGVRVQRSTDGTTFDWYINLAADTTSYVDTGLDNGTRYYYRVRAYGNDADTPYTVKTYATTVMPPVADLAVTSQADGSAHATWENQSDDASSIQVRLIDGDTGTVTNTQTLSGDAESAVVPQGAVGGTSGGVIVVTPIGHDPGMPIDEPIDNDPHPVHRVVSISGVRAT